MALYSTASFKVARHITKAYSTSFSSATRLISAAERKHIYNIYGLVRVADEIVDTYHGKDAGLLLSEFEEETYQAIKRGYSTNIIIHAFSETARTYGITKKLLAPFFQSMRFDLEPVKNITERQYKDYIYGSAEVVGLMCLTVYCGNDKKLLKQLTPWARKLGSAFQKVNFLRDIADDTKRLGRHYFPDVSSRLTEADKQAVIPDIESDFNDAYQAALSLPRSSRTAVFVAYRYYRALLKKLNSTPIEKISEERIRVSNIRKALIILSAIVTTPLLPRPEDV